MTSVLIFNLIFMPITLLFFFFKKKINKIFFYIIVLHYIFLFIYLRYDFYLISFLIYWFGYTIFDFCILLNTKCYIFFFSVLLVCFFIFIYCFFYFVSFYFSAIFFCFIVLFFFSIKLYLVSFNFIFTFIGWEFMGICSFFLIFTFLFRSKAKYSAFIALIWNILGDFCLFFFFISTWFFYFSFSYNFSLFHALNYFVIIFAVFCKSALFPFHNWLFHAMEGPTPVSALLHAASMITAGVFLCLYYILSFNWYLLFFFGLANVFFFSFCAFLYFDAKKIIASSTGSQMGYIYFFVILGFLINSLLLLSVHSLFKSLLFMTAGVIVSACFNFQDFRFIKLNFIYWLIFFFCSFCLIGFPFFWGANLKESLLLNFLNLNNLSLFFFALILIFSLFYSFRLICVSIFNFIDLNFIYFHSLFTFFFLFFILFFFYFLSCNYNLSFSFVYLDFSYFWTFSICFFLGLFRKFYFFWIYDFFIYFIYFYINLFMNVFFYLYYLSYYFYLFFFY